MDAKYCVHVLLWIGEKTESLILDPGSLRHPYPEDETKKWWFPERVMVRGQEVLLSYRRAERWGDQQLAVAITGIFIGHDLTVPESRNMCDYISKRWKGAANFVDFVFSIDLAESMREIERSYLAGRATGVLDMDKVPFLKRRILKELRSKRDMKVAGHYLYTMQPPWIGLSNYDIFGIHTKYEGANII